MSGPPPLREATRTSTHQPPPVLGNSPTGVEASDPLLLRGTARAMPISLLPPFVHLALYFAIPSQGLA